MWRLVSVTHGSPMGMPFSGIVPPHIGRRQVCAATVEWVTPLHCKCTDVCSECSQVGIAGVEDQAQSYCAVGLPTLRVDARPAPLRHRRCPLRRQHATQHAHVAGRLLPSRASQDASRPAAAAVLPRPRVFRKRSASIQLLKLSTQSGLCAPDVVCNASQWRSLACWRRSSAVPGCRCRRLPVATWPRVGVEAAALQHLRRAHACQLTCQRGKSRAFAHALAEMSTACA